MTRFMLIVTAGLLAASLACSKDESAATKPAAKAPAETSGAMKAGDKAATDAKAAAGAVAANTSTAAAAAINANCPIGGEPVAADGGTTTFKGATIGFCCPKCSGKFAALDDAGKVAALAKNGTKLPE